MNTFLMWLCGLLIGLFALLFAGPYFVDWNSYRGVFEEEATRLLGRRVRVGGNVNVRLLPAPYLLFEDLRIADTTGIAGGPLFKTDSFKMWLAVPPLLKGAFEANKVELERPVLSLAADDQGFGNWRTLLEAKSLPFVPTGVKLDSVLIEDGAISYNIEDGGELARIDKISGELTAQALAGPYSFRGTAALNGRESNVRLATTEADSAGGFRLTVHLSGGKSRDDHKFDGQVRGFWEQPAVDGQLVSRIKVAEPVAAGGKRLVAEARAQLIANGQTLDLDGLTISFEEFAQPQIVTGSLKAQWARQHQVQVALNSRWIDLDQITGGNGEAPANGAGGQQTEAAVVEGQSTPAKVTPAAPLPTARGLIAELLDVFPPNTDVRARLDVDQVNLGGDRVAGLVVALERSGGPLELRTLRAVLPGGARLNFSGQVEAVEGQPVFDGDLFIGGVSAARIIRWAVASEDVNSIISDGPFSVSGRMQLGTDRVMLKSAVAEFSGVPIRGSMTWDDGERYVELNVEGYEIDTRWFGLGKLEMPALAQVLSASGSTADNKDAADGNAESGLYGWLDQQDRELRVDLSAGRLTDGTNTLRDVEAQLRMRGRRIDIKRVRLITSEGLSADLRGGIDGVGLQPKGAVDYLVSAKDRAAAWKLADLWAGEAAAPVDRDRFAAFAPIRVAGRMQLGQRGERAADFTFDGTAGGGRLEATLLLNGGIGGWGSAPVDFTLRSNAADTGQLFVSLAGGRSSEDTASAGGDPGKILVKAVGVPKKGLLTLATIESPRISFVFDGTTQLNQHGVSSLEGELLLRDGDIRKLVRLAGLRVPGGVGKIGYDGLADVAWVPGRFSLTPRDVTFSGARVGGRLVISMGEDGGRRIDGKLVADAGSLPRILSALLSEPDAAPTELLVAKAEAAVGEEANAIADAGVGQESPPVFSDLAFDLSLIDGVTGAIELSTGRLEIGPGLSVSEARAEFRAADGKLSFGLTGSQALGGNLKATLEVEKAAAGAVSSGTLELAGVDLGNLPLSSSVGSAGAFGKGSAELRLEFRARGLTPRGMVSVMTGKGELQLDSVTMAGLAPSGVRQAADATLKAEVFSTQALLSSLKAAHAGGRLVLGSRRLPLTISDGAVQVASFDVDQENGRSRIVTTVDLRGLVYDSEWRVVANDPQGRRAWPPVSVSAVGPLTKLGALETRITADALERELAVRKMERNVNELERLRRLDEDAAARQRKRQQQLELESQRLEARRAAAAAAAAGSGAGENGQGGNGQTTGGWSATSEPAPNSAWTGPTGAGPGNSGAAGQDAADSFQPEQYKPRLRKSQKKPFSNQIFGID